MLAGGAVLVLVRRDFEAELPRLGVAAHADDVQRALDDLDLQDASQAGPPSGMKRWMTTPRLPLTVTSPHTLRDRLTPLSATAFGSWWGCRGSSM